MLYKSGSLILSAGVDPLQAGAGNIHLGTENKLSPCNAPFSHIADLCEAWTMTGRAIHKEHSGASNRRLS